MPQRCQVCIHPQVADVNDAVIAGEPHTAVAKRFGVSRFSIRRHAVRHVPVLMAEAAAAHRFTQAVTLVDRLEQLTGEAHRIKGKAEASGDLRTSLAAVRELVRVVELLARLDGEIDEQPVINIAVVPEWRIVLGVLEAYPEARIAVARALEGGAA